MNSNTRDPQPTTTHEVWRTAADNESLLPSYTPAKYGIHSRYKSEAEYLAALREWVEERGYTGLKNDKGRDTTVEGFFGAKTMRDYEKQERPSFGFGRKRGVDHGSGEGREVQGAKEGSTTRRRSSVVNWLRRQTSKSQAEGMED